MEQPTSSGVNSEMNATPESPRKRATEELLDSEGARGPKPRVKAASSVTDEWVQN